MPNRKSSSHDFKQLSEVLSYPLTPLFEEVARRSFDDLTQVNWARQYHTRCPADISAMARLAEAFISPQREQALMLPPSAIPYLNAHRADLDALVAATQEMMASGRIEFSADIFNKDGAIEYALTLMAQDERLDQEQMLLIIQNTRSVKTFAVLLAHPHADASFYHRILALDLESECLCALAEKIVDKRALMAHPRCNDAVLQAILRQDDGMETLLAITTQALTPALKEQCDALLIRQCAQNEQADAYIQQHIEDFDIADLLSRQTLGLRTRAALQGRILAETASCEPFLRPFHSNPNVHVATLLALLRARPFDKPMGQRLLLAAQRPEDIPPEYQALSDALDKLRVKALAFMNKQETDPNERYHQAAKAAFSLYVSASQSLGASIRGEKTPEILAAEIQAAVNIHKPVLETHRGMKKCLQSLCDVVNWMLRQIGVLAANTRFFKIHTLSSQMVQEIENHTPGHP